MIIYIVYDEVGILVHLIQENKSACTGTGIEKC